MASKWLFGLIMLTSSLVMVVHTQCTPNVMADALQKCLQYQTLNTYWQFPFVAASAYSNLCANSTCLSYCYDLVTLPCSGQYYTDHLGDGKPIKAAYLGFCDLNRTDVEAALTCAGGVNNQDVLNAVSAFQTTIQGYADTAFINASALCSDFRTLLNTTEVLVTAQCSGNPLVLWQTFFNTLHAACDNTLTPSYYTTYKDTTVSQCAGVNCVMYDLYTLLFCAICFFIHRYIREVCDTGN